MSIKQYPGGIITKNPTAPTTSSAKGIWTLDQAQNYTKQGIWPRSPGAPTIGAISQASATAAFVAFTAPSCTGSNAITGYTAISSPGCITGTGASSPVTVSGLTTGTAYTFRVRATNGAGTGPLSAASASFTPAVTGQEAYTTNGTYSWVAPSGVTSVSVVAVGGGAGAFNNGYCCGCNPYYSGGGGGGLGYKNNYSVTPGSSYTVVVGNGGPVATGFGSPTRTNGQDSYFVSTGTVAGLKGTYSGGGSYVGDGGGVGGLPSYVTNTTPGGAGAGGYSGSGGNAGTSGSRTGKAGSGGGGSGGGYGAGCGTGGNGGGVGILGQGTSGAEVAVSTNGNPGSGGSGMVYGGGGSRNEARAGVGAVRIIWPGTSRSFPSTNTGDL